MSPLLCLLGLAQALAAPSAARDADVLAAEADTAAAGTAVRRSTARRDPVVARLGAATPADAAVQVHGATPVACETEPVSPGTLTDALVQAARQVDYVEYAAALQTTRDALGGLPCLAGPLPGPTVSRLAFLSGIVAYEEGQAAAAQEAFALARRVQTDLAWDDAFAPDARGLFDAAAPAPPTAPLAVFPARLPVWVDGAAWRPGTAVGIGLHIVQLGLPDGTWTRRIDIASDGLQIVVPGLLGDADLSAVAQTDAGPALARSLDSDQAPPPLVFFDEALWRWEGAVWQRHTPARVPRALPGALTGAGAVATLVGAPVMITAWVEAQRAWTDGSGASDWAGFVAARDRYGPAQARLAWSRWVVVGGLGLVGTGQVLGVRRRRAQLRPVATPGGAGLQLQVGAP